MSLAHDDDEYLSRLRREVEEELRSYRYEVPQDSIGQPKTDSDVASRLAEMRASLVEPYWVEVELRDTFEQAGPSVGPRRKCAVVADDNKGFLLLFDPAEKSFVLALHTPTGLTTFGVRGDAVGCFLAR